jgi:hypothetical protein
MKTKILGWAMVSILFMGLAGITRAEDDARIIGKIGHNQPMEHLRTASLYLVFKGNKDNSLPAVKTGDNTRYYSKVWDGLYLQVTTETGQDGVAGYLFSFSKDEENKYPMDTNESRDVPTLRDLASADFRSDDNFSARALKPGPGTPDDRGALRMIHYEGFDVEIRVLEFNIGNPSLKTKPYFKSVSSLVTVREKAPASKE